MWNVILRRWKFKIGVLVVAALGVLLDQGDARVFEKISIALIFILIVFLIEILFELNEYLAKAKLDSTEQIEIMKSDFITVLKGISSTINHKLDNVDNKIKVQASDAEMSRAIIRFHPPIKQVLKKVHSELRETLDVDNDGFVIKNHSFALVSYVQFWESLVDEQTRRRHDSVPQNLTVVAVHSCAIDIWDDPILETVFSEQANFIQNGGKISRILCGHGPPNEHYCTVARKMDVAKIAVTYFDMNKKLHGPNSTWDFLLVVETGTAVIWTVDAQGKILNAVYMDRPNPKQAGLKPMWDKISRLSKGFSGM